MHWILVILASILGGAAFYTTRRAARVRRWAKRRSGQYIAQKYSLLTPQSTQKAELLCTEQGVFRHVITWRHADSFIRLSDAFLPHPFSQRTALPAFTLFTAERMNGQWPCLKIVPFDSPFRQSRLPHWQGVNIAGYTVFANSAEAAKLFTASLRHLLAERKTIYIELTPQAFIYHESLLVPPAQLEDFQRRAQRLLQEWEQLFAAKSIPAAPAAPTLQPDHELEQRLQALLPPVKTTPLTAAHQGISGWKIVILLLLVLLLPALVWLLRNYLPH